MAQTKPQRAADDRAGYTERVRGLFSMGGEQEMGNRFLFRLTAFAVAMAMVVLGAGVALADEVIADADILTTGDQTTRGLGTSVAPGAVLSTQVSLSLLCAGKDHLDGGQSATVSLTSATIQKSGGSATAAGSAVTASSVQIGAAPASWPDDSADCPSPAPVLQDNGDSDVSITAPLVAGSYTVSLTYAKSGALSPAGTGDSNAVKKSPTVTFTFTVVAPSDTTAPNTTITAAPASDTNSTSAEFTFTSNETPSTFECKLDGGGWAACNSGSISYPGPLSSGPHTFLVQAKDAAGNQDASPASHSWTIDTTLPMGSVNVNNGDAYTNSSSATLSLTADADTTHYRKAQGPNCSTVTFSTVWIAMASSVAHDLGAGDGSKNVCVQFKDGAGNISTPASDSIILDTASPAGIVSINDGAAFTKSASVTLTLTADPDVTHYRKAQGADCSAVSTADWTAFSTPVSHNLGSTDGMKNVCVQFRDAASNSSTIASDTIQLDTTAPTITATATKTKGTATPTPYTENSWTNADQVDITYSCTDTGGSELTGPYTDSDSVTDPGTSSATSSEACIDNAGNAATAKSFGVKIDRSAPTITATATKTKGTATPTPYTENSWTNADQVDITYSCTDTGGSDVSGTYSDSDSVTAEGESTQGSGVTCTDGAGNDATAKSVGVKIDRTAPSNLAFVGGPNADAMYYFGDVPSAPSCTAEDTLSLLTTAGCTVRAYSAEVGSHTMTASATDNAGNTGTLARSYTVNSWTLKGFYSPVDMGGVKNLVKGGSTVPLKFEVFAGPTTEFTDTSVIKSFKVGIVPCTTLAGTSGDDIEQYSTGGTSLRYDFTGGQFVQNWKVPSGSNICYKVELITQDSSSAIAFFKTK